MLSVTFEEFNHAQQVVHHAAGVAAARQLMAFRGVADVLYRLVENF